VVTTHPISAPRFDSAGLPLPGVEVRIASDGEVLVRGANVTPGYWEAPEQTEATFEDGWYKTGDLGSLDEGGFLHLNGRKKDMIVLANGQNVYPDDVEAVLKAAPGVADAAVVGLPRGSGTEVHAALILADGGDATEAVRWANQQLASHQHILGSTLWPSDEFPRTHTLKVKKHLILEALTQEGAAAVASAPSTATPTGARGVEHVIADIARVALGEVTPEKALEDGFALDSIGRIELFSAIEEELGVVIDETRVGPETTVAELAAIVREGTPEAAKQSFARWGMAPWCRGLRGLIQRAVIFPGLAAAYRLRVTGTENLENLRGSMLLAANHSLGMDHLMMLRALPGKHRRRLAIAAAADLWQNKIRGVANPLLGNGFPFAREGPVRPSLDNLGRILDDGWSVLIFPEGQLTIGGPIKPFKGGTGLIAVESHVPVVPVRLHIHRSGTPRQYPLLRRGDVEISFGKPLEFAPGTSYVEATEAIETAVRTL
jgi:long-chain acyl-CoA synthetase